MCIKAAVNSSAAVLPSIPEQPILLNRGNYKIYFVKLFTESAFTE